MWVLHGTVIVTVEVEVLGQDESRAIWEAHRAGYNAQFNEPASSRAYELREESKELALWHLALNVVCQESEDNPRPRYTMDEAWKILYELIAQGTDRVTNEEAMTFLDGLIMAPYTLPDPTVMAQVRAVRKEFVHGNERLLERATALYAAHQDRKAMDAIFKELTHE